MKTLRRHWYNIGLVVAIIVIVFLVINWNDIQIIRKLLLLNFIALLLHQFEEYGLPGGEPAIMNMVLQPSDVPDRYPLNQHSAMVVNVLAAYLFYLIPVFFPNVIWLGLAPVLFGLGQFLIHGIVTNIKLKTFYNPGLGAVVFLHIPIGIYYIHEIYVLKLVSYLDWIFGVVYLVAFAFITLIKMTYTWLADKNSKYVFPPDEMKRFNVVEKLARIAGRQQ
jgi:Protein of unknown function with HXXEE motif